MTAASLAALLVWGGPAGAGGRPFEILLTGAEEVSPPNPHGNADRGSIRLTLNQGQGEICFELGRLVLTAGEPLPHLAHIHVGERGEAGPPVVTLFTQQTAPTQYPTTEERCVPAASDLGAARELVKEIRKNPENYYVNLHNRTHPTGVVRGQLAD